VIAGANGTVATNSGGSSITLSGADVYSSVAATDQIIISGYTATTANAADNTLVAAVDTDLSDATAANTYGLQRGDYVQTGTTSGTGTFILGAGGGDMLFVYDSDIAQATTTIEAIVLQGATTLTATAAGAGIVTLA